MNIVDTLYNQIIDNQKLTNHPMVYKQNRPPIDLHYYLTLFTLEGHKTWRVHLSGHKDGFDTEQKTWAKGSAKITQKQVLIIDRLTGGFVNE